MKAGFHTPTTADGFALPVYLAEPDGAARGHVLVIQEIFGPTANMKRIADSLADAGYRAALPDLFARTGRSEPVSYGDPETGLALVGLLDPAGTDADLDAALDLLGDPQRTGVLGFCWGGGLAWRTGARRQLPATVCYYPTRMSRHLPLAPDGEALVHLAEGDRHTPPGIVEAMRAAKPDLTVLRWKGEHGFHNPDRDGYAPGPAKAAWEATLEVFGRVLG